MDFKTSCSDRIAGFNECTQSPNPVVDSGFMCAENSGNHSGNIIFIYPNIAILMDKSDKIGF